MVHLSLQKQYKRRPASTFSRNPPFLWRPKEVPSQHSIKTIIGIYNADCSLKYQETTQSRGKTLTKSGKRKKEKTLGHCAILKTVKKRKQKNIFQFSLPGYSVGTPAFIRKWKKTKNNIVWLPKDVA